MSTDDIDKRITPEMLDNRKDVPMDELKDCQDVEKFYNTKEYSKIYSEIDKIVDSHADIQFGDVVGDITICVMKLCKEQLKDYQESLFKSGMVVMKDGKVVKLEDFFVKESICDTAPYPQCNGANGCDSCEHQPEE